ncbi:hypothetical protein H2203_008747 [Taxawa tesnikishii (nom. ined.)]|nr:hypothetical protein H2203_008747 [Dothideales sp. JES 119]
MRVAILSTYLLSTLTIASAVPAEPQPAAGSLTTPASATAVPVQTAAPQSDEILNASQAEAKKLEYVDIHFLFPLLRALIPLSVSERFTDPRHRLRQAVAVANPATTLAQAQVPTVTSWWQETTIGTRTTWVQVFYTQTFAKVPDQLPSAQAGSIGMGTLTGNVGVVRTAEAKKASGAGRSSGSVVAAAAALGAVVAVVGLS